MPSPLSSLLPLAGQATAIAAPIAEAAGKGLGHGLSPAVTAAVPHVAKTVGADVEHAVHEEIGTVVKVTIVAAVATALGLGALALTRSKK